MWDARALYTVSGVVHIPRGLTFFGSYCRTQAFDVVLDTGSSDLWVATTACVSCPRTIPVFDPSKSNSFNATTLGTTIRYGQGQVTGQIVEDVVSMAGFSVTSQTFCVSLFFYSLFHRRSRLSCLVVAATDLSRELLGAQAAGLMGLGFTSLAATRSTPFWEALSDGGQFTTPEMGFQFTRERGNPSAQSEEFGGTFTLGGTNSSLFTGDIEFLDMPSGTPSFWLLNMAGEWMPR